MSAGACFRSSMGFPPVSFACAFDIDDQLVGLRH